MATTVEEHRDSVMSELEVQMKNASPEKCITLSNSSPSVKMFYALRLRLENTSEAWLREYLERDGLDIMLHSLCEMTGKAFTSFSDAILQLDCVSCIRAILNTSVGLDFMVKHEDYTAKLILALNMNNTHPKKQVYEVLSALCSYNNMGYNNVMNALAALKKETDQTYRFSAIVNELKAAETVPHKTAILTFINCIINCTPDLQDRNRIRNEFVGLNLLDVLNFLRKEEVDNDLHLQLQVFHEKKHEDEEALTEQNEVDFNSPEDLIELIQCKIFGTPKMVSFLNILQDLLAIENIYSKHSAKLWKEIDNLVHQSVHACEQSQLPKCVKTPVMDLASLPDHINKGLQCIQTYQSKSQSPNVDPLMSGAHLMSGVNLRQISQRNLDPCKYENDTGVELTHNRDPRYNKFNNVVDMIAYMDQTQYDNVSFNDDSENSNNTPTNKSALQKRYRIKRPPLPPPTRKTKNVPWVKIADEVIEKFRDCVWAVSAESNGISPDFGQLETMFQQGDPQYEEVNEIVLLNSTTRQNINLFLSRMEIGPEKLIESLEKGNPEVISLPTLQYLMKVLPDFEEIVMLQKYDGRRLQLGMPEQFVLLLADIPDYQVLIEGHLTKAESITRLDKLKDSLNSLTAVCKVVLENQHFKKFLHFLLCAGNFLNYGCLQGDAAGIKLSSFERLMEVKSGVPNQSLLHHLVKVANDNDAMLKFIPEMGQLDKISLSSLVEIKDEINKFNKQLCKFINHLVTANIKLRQRFHIFIEEVKLELLTIQSATNQLRTMTLRMANFFCEDPHHFDLEATLQCLQSFCKQVKRCQNDNASFYKQSQLAKKKNEQTKFHIKNRFMALEFGKDAGASSSILEDKHKVLEKILDDLHHGNFHPVVRSEVQTPDTDMEALEFSNISFIGSPVSRRPMSEVMDEDFLTPTLKHVNIRTSSAADILSDEPKFEQELITAKEASPELMTDLPLIAKRVEELKITSKRRCHSRSRSDLTDSILITEKWMKYEELVHQESMYDEGVAPLAELESMCNITCLNLENNGKSVDRDDLKYYEEQQKYDYTENVCCLQDGPVVKIPTEKFPLLQSGTMGCKPKSERKSSVSNFFTKISRAVLKPKNTPESEPQKGKKEKFGMFGRRKTLASDDKENIPYQENVTSMAEKRFASREYKRFKNEKSRLLKAVK